MGFLKNFFTEEEQVTYQNDEQNYEASHTPAVTNREAVRPVVNKRALINICEPRVYSEVEDMATLLMNKQVIIVNFKRMDKAQASRVIDYLTGIIFAVQGSVQKLQHEIFLFSPADIGIEGVLEGLEDQDKVDYLDMV